MENYKIFADYHTHTIHSHGTGTVDENIKAAISAGLDEIGIADHGPAHVAYGIRNLDKYLDDIHRAQDKFSAQIRIVASIECNLLSLKGDIDLPDKYADRFDIVIFGYHKFVRTKGFASTAHLYLTGKNSLEKNTQAYINALEKNRIDIISHPGYGIAIDYISVARACAKYGTAFEINNKHCDFTNEILQKCAAEKCKFVVSSDAHSPDRIGCFNSALARVSGAKLSAEEIINAMGA